MTFNFLLDKVYSVPGTDDDGRGEGFMEQKNNSDLIISWLKKISPQFRSVFFGVLLFGLLAQGMGLFNKFSHHDDVAILFDMGTTISSGRWMLQVLTVLEGKFYGTVSTSLPLFNGVVSLLCLGAVGGLLVRLLRIENRVYCFLLGCVMAAFPMITALFAYMFTSHPYMIGLLMMTVSACLICGKNSWWMKIAGLLIGGAGVGIYQAYLRILVTAVLFYHIMETAEGGKSARDCFLSAAFHVLCILGVMLVYWAGNRFFLYKYQVELSAYQGIADMGQMTLQTLLGRIGRAYREFFLPTRQVFGDMYPGTLYALHAVMLGAMLLLALREVALAGKKDWKRGALLAAMFLLVPLGSNLIYVMVEEEVHALMTYGQIMQVVLFVWLFDRLELSSRALTRGAAVCASLVLAVTSLMYARYDNQCYLKDALHQQEAISYYTTLITRIKSLPGFQPKMRVLYANTENAKDPTVYNIDELDFIRINPYWHNSMEYLHCPTWETFMKVWCGADFRDDWDPYLDSRPEVQAMPSYPADGSIKIIDGAVVVKF